VINALIDYGDAVAARWRVPLTILSAAFFVLSCASYAGFVRLPELSFLSGLPVVIAAAAWNAIWWGFLYPRAERRRAERGLDMSRG
jgi:hypothetical protein